MVIALFKDAMDRCRFFFEVFDCNLGRQCQILIWHLASNENLDDGNKRLCVKFRLSSIIRHPALLLLLLPSHRHEWRKSLAWEQEEEQCWMADYGGESEL